MAVEVWRGSERLGLARHGRARRSWNGEARSGEPRFGLVWKGEARHGLFL